MTTTGSLVPASAYGARPVSVDIARGRSLVEAKVPQQTDSPITKTTLPFSHQVVADRLSLAHWPPGQQIVVCSLAGGTGGTTLAGLLATACQGPGDSAHRWSVNLPTGGHQNCPVMAS